MRLLLLAALATPLFAQGLHFGLKAGVPATAYFETGQTGSLHGGSEYSAATRRYTVGASVEWRLTHTFGFELDTLYKRMGYVGIVTSFWNGILTTAAFDTKGDSWDFPLLAKYRFGRVTRPYIEGSRASLFAELDRPALQPLPSEHYVLAYWKTVRASIDYHVEVDRHYYSVPYQLAGQKLEARYTAATIEIFHGGKRVASHARNSFAYRHTTVAEHMPKSHQAHLEWTPSRLIHWAEGIGASTAQVVQTILERKPHPEMGYRACLGILRLEKAYSRARLEAASQRAVQLQTFSYQSLKSILKNSLDRQLLLEPEAAHPGPQHENLRGPHYYAAGFDPRNQLPRYNLTRMCKVRVVP